MLMNVYAVILLFHDFHLRGQTKVEYIKKYAIKRHLSSVSPDPYFETEQRQDIFKQTYRNVVFRDYILT